MTTQTEYTTIQTVERYAAEHGVILSPADKAKILQVQQAEQQRLEQLHPVSTTAPTWADRFNQQYPRLLDALLGIGDVIITLAKTLILSLGIPFGLLGLLVVEHHRVVQGIMLFDQNEIFAGIAAGVLVAINLILEFQVHHIEHQAGYTPDRARKWSLRIWWRNFLYTVGAGEQWTERELSPAHRYHNLLKLVTFTILALALVGSMKDVIQSTPGVWHQALISIITDSPLLLMGTWLSGLLFALAAVMAAQGLSRYVAIRTVEIVAQMRSAPVEQDATPHAAAVEQAGAVAALAIVNERLAKKEAKGAPEENPLALPHMTTISMNGNGTSGH